MVNKKRHMKVKLWSVRTLIILFFAISAITLSQGIVYVQDIVKERFSVRLRQYRKEIMTLLV